ncbi:uncharacterized protein LOC129304360 [Prosopis cineraria]|uniref:uncharacterized protein LOC129304360 n=1 Tax=Prosopis cineraria TaxID=364024 RepID=UPI00240F54CD|nr:uncharacterized protein LOC129304360 [Prosopis cineraria]
MGNKLTAGGDNGKGKTDVIDDCYSTYFESNDRIHSASDFCRAIVDTVKELNKKHGYTQVKAPSVDSLEREYKKYCKDGKGKPSKEDFKKIMGSLEKEAELTGVGGVKDTLLYIFGVPASATFLKNAVMPGLVSNEILIPTMTSLTALVLAKLNKI